MRINCIKCDICGSTIDNNIATFGGWRFKFKPRKQLDICDKCLIKLYIVADDVQSEEELANEIFQLKHAENYQDEYMKSAYLAGISDALETLAPYKIRQCKESKRLFNDPHRLPPKKPIV